MHIAAYNFVRECILRLPQRQGVIEYGGRNINGTVRELFRTPSYISIDLIKGSGVDVVADAVSFVPPIVDGIVVDTVVCCEVLEHSDKWPFIIKAASKILDPATGILILTCATDPRAPHSSADGGNLYPGEYYKNVDVVELTNALDTSFEKYEVSKTDDGDLQVLAWVKTPAGE